MDKMRALISAEKSWHVLPINIVAPIRSLFLWPLSCVPSQVDNVPTWKLIVFDRNMLPGCGSITYYQCYDAKLHHLDHLMMNLFTLVT